MKLRMLTSLSGPDYTVAFGDITERFDDVEGQNLIDIGYAELAPETERDFLLKRLNALEIVAVAHDEAESRIKELEKQHAASVDANVLLASRVSDLETALADSEKAADDAASVAEAEIKRLGDEVKSLTAALDAATASSAAETTEKPKAAEKRG